MATLLVVHGSQQGKRYDVDQEVVRLGRDPSNSVRVLESEISRHHAEIRREGSSFTLVDLGSSNGTFLNGRRVTEGRLSSGDRIQLGQTVLIFSTGASAARSDLARKISVITRAAADRSSGIVKSISQAEGSQYFKRPEQPDGAWLQSALAHLRVMYETSQAVSHIVDLDQLLERILELAFESVKAERGCMMLIDPGTRQREWRAVKYAPGASSEEQIEVSSTIVEYVLTNGEGVRTSDAATDERFSPGQSIRHYGIREAICVPMQGRHGMIGVIYLDNRVKPQQLAETNKPGGQFSDDHLKLLIAIGHQAALAIEDTRYYQAYVKSERAAAVGQTIAMLSHDIKNILQGVKGGSHLIEMGLSSGEEEQVRRGWNIVNKNQSKIYNLVMDMLSFSKEREPALESSDLNAVVHEVVELMEPRASEIGVQLRWAPDETLPRLAIDPEGIHRAVLNIVSNALDATEDKADGVVEVRNQFAPQQSVARIHVRDNGIGIPREEMSNIFALYSSTKGSRGTGIGLAVSEKIIREHGGRIRVRSQPGEGTEFILELPLRPETVAGNAPEKLESSEPALTDPECRSAFPG